MSASITHLPLMPGLIKPYQFNLLLLGCHLPNIFRIHFESTMKCFHLIRTSNYANSIRIAHSQFELD
jgi:hypothetical protein